MTTMKTVFIQKPYQYTSIKPYPIGDRRIGYKHPESGTGPLEPVDSTLYRILAGRQEHGTKLIMFKNYKNNWVLEVETPEGDAVLEVFFASHNISKSEMQTTILEWINRGFKVVECPRGRLWARQSLKEAE